jgi:hypothetical protein
MIRSRLLILAFLFTPLALTMGCSKDPDATGENGIGAPGVVNPETVKLSDQEAHKLQEKQEEELRNASNGKKAK